MTSNRNNIQKKLILAMFILLLVVIICFLVLKFMHNIQNLTLQNTWRSEETGQVLTFTDDNLVEFDGNFDDPGTKNAIRAVNEEASSLKILGNF